MTTNPETAWVEPVAEMRERLRRIASLANAATTFHEEAMMRNYQSIAELIHPAPASNTTSVGEGAVTDCVVAASARRALGTWLAWPDAARDGPVTVTNEQVESWLSGLPNTLAAIRSGSE